MGVQSDAFRIAADRGIGAVEAVRVTVDTEKERAGLYLARVEVEDTSTGLWSIFPCGQWLDPSVGHTMRTLPVKTAGGGGGGGGGGGETMSSTLEEQLRGELSVERTRVKTVRAESEALRRQLSAAAASAPEAAAAERDAALARAAELQRQVAEIQAQMAGVEEEYSRRFDATIAQLDTAHQVRAAGPSELRVRPIRDAVSRLDGRVAVWHHWHHTLHSGRCGCLSVRIVVPRRCGLLLGSWGESEVCASTCPLQLLSNGTPPAPPCPPPPPAPHLAFSPAARAREWGAGVLRAAAQTHGGARGAADGPAERRHGGAGEPHGGRRGAHSGEGGAGGHPCHCGARLSPACVCRRLRLRLRGGGACCRRTEGITLGVYATLCDGDIGPVRGG